MRVRLKHQRLLELLAESRLSQNHWALKIGISRGHWSEIVNGKHPYPSPKTRERILETFALPLEELFEIEAGLAPWADTDFRRAIADRYLIDSELGQGGMGAVYLARDVRHGRTIAVKVISPEAVSGIGVTQFLREIATVAQLQHPHILPLFDSGDAAGHPFYAMPYVRSGSLRARLEASTRLPVAEVARLATGIAAALHHAHAHRVLHCDIKPENILIDAGHPYVMDFGIARKLHSEVFPWTLRRELDLSAGTPAYVSPEQASGERELDARSDVYSLACVVYEMLSGRKPFEGTTTEAIVSKRFVEPPPPIREFAPEVPAAMEAAVTRAMAVEPSRRPASAGEFAEAISAAAAHASGAFAAVSVTLTRALAAVRRKAGFNAATRLGGPTVESIRQDLALAWRGLKRSPGFALVVILTLGIAIAANATMFGITDRLLFQPPPGIGQPEQIRRVLVSRWFDELKPPSESWSYPAFNAVKSNTRSFEQVAAVETAVYSMGSGAGARSVTVTLGSGQYFPLLRVPPFLGRYVGEGDDRPPGGERVAVLSFPFWQTSFAGDPNIVGKTVPLSGQTYEIIGVAPRGFNGTEFSPVDLWIPLSTMSGMAELREQRGAQWIQTLARLKVGVADGTAEEDATRVYQLAHADMQPEYERRAVNRLGSLIAARNGSRRGAEARVSAWLLGVTAVLLVIACANVANLMLARGLKRRGEIAVRLALGVSRGRLLRQLLTESLFLAVLGAVAGLFITSWGAGLVRSVLLPGRIWGESPVNGRVLILTGVVTTVAALVAGLFPLLKATRTDLATALHGGARTTMRHSRRVRTTLLLLQTSLCTALLIGAGLFLRSMDRVANLDLGFRPERLSTLSVDIESLGLTPEQVNIFYREAVERVRQLPGVASAGLTQGAPFLNNYAQRLRLPGADSIPPKLKGGGPYFFRATDGLLETLGVRVVAGRLFTAGDDRVGAPPVMVVTQRMAETLWKARNPIGQCVLVGEPGVCHEVVGVVADLHRQGLEEDPFLLYFTPLGQRGAEAAPEHMIIRTTRDAEALAEPLRRALAAIRSDLPFIQLRSYESMLDSQARSWRLGATMLTIFGAISLIVAAIGLYGVLSYSVTQRAQELGLRSALGATPANLLGLILREGLIVAFVGIVLGFGLALVLSRRLTDLLFQTSARDPLVFAATGVIVVAIALVASAVPGRRATRVDPLTALRAE
ncbi:MAG: protein kinase [Gemmatimonadales bacterium]|nr:protein kinase [Gemmatimonadales bacterium]